MSSEIQLDSIYTGKIIRIKPFGVIVQFNENSQGLVHISHVSNKFVQDINDFLSVGDCVKVKVIGIDAENKKISLSIKETEEAKTDEQKTFNRVSGNYRAAHQESYAPQSSTSQTPSSFEDKMKDWLKASNELHASLNKRNKRR